MRRKKLKTQYIIIAVLAILLLLVTILNIYMTVVHDWHPKPYEVGRVIDTPPPYKEPIKAEAKQMVKALYNTPHILKETDMQNDGDVNYFLRTVYVRKGVPVSDFILFYAHELTHLKYWCENETFVMYKTITTLYESNNQTLKSIAVNAANFILDGNLKYKQYDCGYYLLKYFGG